MTTKNFNIVQALFLQDKRCVQVTLVKSSTSVRKISKIIIGLGVVRSPYVDMYQLKVGSSSNGTNGKRRSLLSCHGANRTNKRLFRRK